MSERLNSKPYKKIWAVLSVDKNGNEGICALNMFGMPTLAVTGAEDILEMFKDVAKKGLSEAGNEGLKIVIGEYNRCGTQDL